MSDHSLRQKPLGDHDAPRPDEDFHKHPLIPAAQGFNPVDGLPSPAISVDIKRTEAPALTPESFICMADTSLFVIREVDGTVLLEVDPKDVRQAPIGYWYLPVRELGPKEWAVIVMALRDSQAFAGVTKNIPKDMHKEAWAQNSFPPQMKVLPVRPQCKFYRRQLSDHQGDAEHRSMNRYCIAMRDDHGEFVSLRDGRMYACEMRDPRHVESEEALDAFDQKAIAKAREQVAEFDVDAALEGEPGGGIFK